MLKFEGKSLWTKVFEPDTRFVPEGEYSTQVIVSEKDAQSVCERLEKLAKAKFDEAVKDNPKLKNVLSMRPVSEPEYDEAGNETGNVIFKTKLKARIKSRAGEVYNQKVAVLDAKKTPMNGDQMIGNGSTIKVAVEPVPYVMQSTKQVGVSLRLKGVQVLNLVEYGSPSVDSLFDEEDGFVANAVAKDDASDAAMFDDDDTTSENKDAEGDF